MLQPLQSFILLWSQLFIQGRESDWNEFRETQWWDFSAGIAELQRCSPVAVGDPTCHHKERPDQQWSQLKEKQNQEMWKDSEGFNRTWSQKIYLRF